MTDPIDSVPGLLAELAHLANVPPDRLRALLIEHWQTAADAEMAAGRVRALRNEHALRASRSRKRLAPERLSALVEAELKNMKQENRTKAYEVLAQRLHKSPGYIGNVDREVRRQRRKAEAANSGQAETE